MSMYITTCNMLFFGRMARFHILLILCNFVVLKPVLFLQVDMASAMFSFAYGFNSLNLNDTEIGLFSAIVLLTAGKSVVIQYLFNYFSEVRRCGFSVKL